MNPYSLPCSPTSAKFPTFRRARGQRFAWLYLLALVAAAVAAGQTERTGDVDWPGAMPVSFLARCNRPVRASPSPATWRRLLIHIDLTALEQWVAAYKPDRWNQAMAWLVPWRCKMVNCGVGKPLNGKETCAAPAPTACTPSWSVWCATTVAICAGASRRSTVRLMRYGGAALAGRPRPDRHCHHHGCAADTIRPGAADPPPKRALPDGDQEKPADPLLGRRVGVRRTAVCPPGPVNA